MPGATAIEEAGRQAATERRQRSWARTPPMTELRRSDDVTESAEYFGLVVIRDRGSHQDGVRAGLTAAMNCFVRYQHRPQWTDWLESEQRLIVRIADDTTWAALEEITAHCQTRCGTSEAMAWIPTRGEHVPLLVRRLPPGPCSLPQSTWTSSEHGAKLTILLDDIAGLCTTEAVEQGIRALVSTQNDDQTASQPRWNELEAVSLHVEGAGPARFAQAAGRGIGESQGAVVLPVGAIG